MIQAKFGLPDIAVRTMEVYTTATLEATLARAPEPQARMARAPWIALSDTGRARHIAPSSTTIPEFLDYFQRGHAGTGAAQHSHRQPPSRAARRDGVEGLRAIPWQFAWTQTRLLLASWLGVEDALDDAAARGDEARH